MPQFKNRKNTEHKIGDRVVWESRSVAVVCVVVAKYQEKLYILIGKRGSGLPDAVGRWNLPCGYLDWDETGTEAVYREVHEETGVDLQEQNIEFSDLNHPWFVNTMSDENRQNVALRYGCVIVVNELPTLTSQYSEPNEVADIRWIEFKDVDDYDLAFNHGNVIKQYFKRIVMYC